MNYIWVKYGDNIINNHGIIITCSKIMCISQSNKKYRCITLVEHIYHMIIQIEWESSKYCGRFEFACKCIGLKVEMWLHINININIICPAFWEISTNSISPIIAWGIMFSIYLGNNHFPTYSFPNSMQSKDWRILRIGL